MRPCSCCLTFVPFLAFAVNTWTDCCAFGAVPVAFAGIKKGGISNTVRLKQQRKVRSITIATASISSSSFKQLCATGVDGDDDANDPSNWFYDTEPFYIIRHFAPKPKVSDDEIEQALEVNAIRTLDDLKEKCDVLISLLNPDTFFDMAIAVSNALNRTRKTAEQILGEAKIIYDTTCLPEKCFELYTPGAVSVTPSTFGGKSSKRYPTFSLVLGPSGSGKTLFAIRRIPQMLFGMDETTYFRIHFRAIAVTDLMCDYPSLDFPKAVAYIVKDEIKKQLNDKGLDGVRNLNIHIHITIDEAGGNDNKEYLDTDKKIRSVVAAVKGEGTFRFRREVHVTVAGTRLELTTGGIQTTEMQVKFRMQAWTAQNFDAFINNSKHPEQARVKEIVHRFPILEDLATNARCAFYAYETMENESLLVENRIRHSVAVIVSSVADSYSSDSALAHLKTAKTKWRVIQSVFLELDKSSRSPGEAFFPSFDELGNDDLCSIAISLLDVNVETRNGVPVLLDGCDFAVSITPALAIVVANLVTTNAKVSWDWQGFETIVLLSELKRMIVESQDIPTHPDTLVLQWPAALPAGNAENVFFVPVVDRHTVVLNGPIAKYADVIAPYRLVQAKFSKDNEKALSLNLKGELDNMGLTFSPDHVIQQWITAIFRVFWDRGQEGATWLSDKTLLSLGSKRRRQVCYPFNTLNSVLVSEYPKAVQGVKTNEQWRIEGEAIGVSSWPSTVDERCPVTAVFATNCRALSFKVIRARQEEDVLVEHQDRITITQDDVDCDGMWETTDVEAFSRLGLREGVGIRFLFF